MLDHRPAGDFAWSSRRGDAVAVLSVAGILAAALLFLYLIIPFPHPISFKPAVNTVGSGFEFAPPSGSFVECHWFAVGATTVELVVGDSHDNQLYSSNSSSGSFSFTVTNPPYFVYSFGGEVQVSGTYYSPML